MPKIMFKPGGIRLTERTEGQWSKDFELPKPLIYLALIVLMLLNVFSSVLGARWWRRRTASFAVDGGQVEQVALDETSREIVFIAKDDGGRRLLQDRRLADDGQQLQPSSGGGGSPLRRFPPRPIPSSPSWWAFFPL